MKDRKNLLYLVIISVLIIITLVFWYLIISSNNLNSSNNVTGINNSSSNKTYFAVKKITANENINGRNYKSNTKDENVISALENIKSTISNVTINKTDDSNEGDSTSFYGTNSFIIAK